jgi:Tfp pilus assembly protein PilO
MAKLNEKQKLITLAGCALGLCLLAGGGVWWSKGLIEEEQKAIAAKRTEIAAADQKIAKIPEAEKQVVILRENLDFYVKILPADRDLNVFTRMLNTFQNQSGVHVEEFKPGTASRAAGKGAERFTRIEYGYDLTATLWQAMKFVNSIENYERFVSITSLTITSGDNQTNPKASPRVGDDVVHKIHLTMETYTYNGKATGQEVDIADYEERRVALREEIFKARTKLTVDKWEHKGQLGRRDIFVDPRELGGAQNGNVPSLDQQKILDQFVGEVAQVQDMLLRSKKADTVFEMFGLKNKAKETLAKMDVAIEEVNKKGLIVFQPLKYRWSKEVVEPVKAMHAVIENGDGLNKPDGDPYLSQAETDDLVTAMSKALQSGDLEDARSKYESIQSKLCPDTADRRHEQVVLARSLHTKAVTALDFRSLNLKIQGVLVNKGGRSGVLLNGEVYEEGEYVTDELFVSKVEEEQIRFVFRGLTLIRTL